MPSTITRSVGGIRRRLSLLLLLACAVVACGAPSGPPSITLRNGAIEVAGLSRSTLTALAQVEQSAWPTVFRVAIGADAPAMLGQYEVDGAVVRFTPAFPLDAGRQYEVRFDATSVGDAGAPLTATLGEPAEVRTPSTVVTQVYPTASVVPENILRMYVEFSAPMGRKSGVEYIHLLDHDGREIPGAVLPLDYEFWSPDHKRFTVFFDPGRVKQGILPNREMGRAFTPNKTVTLVIGRDWLDEHGLPLKEEFRRTYQVRAADTRPLNPVRWRVAAPAAGTRDPLRVTFDTPLDHSLLQRALGVRRNDAVVDGSAAISDGETAWAFTPVAPWQPGTYQFLALDILEDVAGNQVGRSFEVDNFDTVDKDPDPKPVFVPFVVR